MKLLTSVVTDPPLTERLQRFYESMSSLRYENLDRLHELFSEDVVFADPFRTTRGLPELRRLFERWLDQYPTVGFTDFRVDGNHSLFTLTYHMHTRMAVGPVFTTPMASLCNVRDGRVVELRDYYDFATALVSPSPALRRLYKGVVNRLFM
jgi:ketosteroid isomerase-like protein